MEESRQCIVEVVCSTKYTSSNFEIMSTFSEAVLVLQATFLYLKYRHVIILLGQLFLFFSHQDFCTESIFISNFRFVVLILSLFFLLSIFIFLLEFEVYQVVLLFLLSLAVLFFIHSSLDIIRDFYFN